MTYQHMILFLAFGTMLSPTLAANQSEQADQAVAIVQKGVHYLQKNGKEALVREVNAKNPAFINGDIYLALRDIDGTTLAHPNNPRLVGKNLLPLPDADGKYFRKDIIEMAKTKGKGWVDYRYNNPVSQTIERKSIYLEYSGGIILEAGIYYGK